MSNLRKLAEQQKNQRALKTKNRILKQTQDNKLSEKLSSITKRIEEVKETTQKLGEVLKESSSTNENNKDIVSFETDSEDD